MNSHLQFGSEPGGGGGSPAVGAAPAVSARLLRAASALCIVISVPAGTRLAPGTGLKRTAATSPPEPSVWRREPLLGICDGKPPPQRRQWPRRAGENRATAGWPCSGIVLDGVFTLSYNCIPVEALLRGAL